MARKVTTQQVRINRAQLKAEAARQAMSGPARSPKADPNETEQKSLDLSGVTFARRRPQLSREQEFAYIRADLVRLALVSVALLVVLIAALWFLR